MKNRMYACALAIGFLSLATLLVSTGCGGASSKEPTVAVSGTITLDDKPLAGATVTFQAAGAKQNYSGKTDSAGKYKFKSAIGASKVAVAKPVSGGKPQDPDEMMTDAMKKLNETGDKGPPANKGDKKKNLQSTKLAVPEKYAQATTSGLEANVTKGGKNQFDFKLSSK